MCDDVYDNDDDVSSQAMGSGHCMAQVRTKEIIVKMEFTLAL